MAVVTLLIVAIGVTISLYMYDRNKVRINKFLARYSVNSTELKIPLIRSVYEPANNTETTTTAFQTNNSHSSINNPKTREDIEIEMEEGRYIDKSQSSTITPELLSGEEDVENTIATNQLMNSMSYRDNLYSSAEYNYPLEKSNDNIVESKQLAIGITMDTNQISPTGPTIGHYVYDYDTKQVVQEDNNPYTYYTKDGKVVYPVLK